jgi:putative NADH-flavin reductase
VRITVIGATGMVGSRVTDEGVRRGHRVTGLSRRQGASASAPPPAGDGAGHVRWVAADAREAVALRPLLAGTDAVVLCVRPAPGDEATLASTTSRVLDVAATTGARVLVVGGAGPLRSPGRPGLLVADDRELVPAEWAAFAAASTEQLRACERHSSAHWAYLSPAALLETGERTGSYRRGTDTLLTDGDGRSRISAEDLAIAVLDELERPSGHAHLTVAH